MNIEERRAQVVRIIEALQEVSDTASWKLLKQDIFDPVLASLERQLRVESKKDILDDAKMYRLQGEIKWASRYSKLDELIETFKVELKNINKQTNENH